MRIIWISVGICLVLLVVAVGFYQPVSNSQQSGSDLQPDVAVNPFAEEDTANAVTDVTLAALPQDTDATAAAQTADELAADPLADQPAVENAVFRETGDAGDKSPNPSFATDTSNATNTTTTATAHGEMPSENSPENADPDVSSGLAAATTPDNTDTTDTKQLATARTSLLSIPSFSQKPENDKVAVIVHANNRQLLSPREIRAMYMDKLTRWDDGKRVMLYNLPLGDKHREQFSKRILNMTALEADKLELKRRADNLAINRVKVKAKNIIVSYVERHPNAIAYVPLSQVREHSDVKVIMTFPN